MVSEAITVIRISRKTIMPSRLKSIRRLFIFIQIELLFSNLGNPF